MLSGCFFQKHRYYLCYAKNLNLSGPALSLLIGGEEERKAILKSFFVNKPAESLFILTFPLVYSR